jgi:uncharacterized coiled-coil DUF342 family protein
VQDLSKQTPAQRKTAAHQQEVGDRQDRTLDEMWDVVQKLRTLAIFKLSALGVMCVVIFGMAIVTDNNGDNVGEIHKTVTEQGRTIDKLEQTVDTLDMTVDEAKAAAEEAREESRQARVELNEAIRLVQENPDDPSFVERVEEGLARIQAIDERLMRIEAALSGG